MKVVDLLENDFNIACKDLAEKIKESFLPDIVISILTGGAYVGHQILNYLGDDNIYYTEIAIQRGHSKSKNIKIVHLLIKIIPKFIANWIRITESAILYLKSLFKKPVRNGILQFDERIEILLKEGNKNILIVDDSIDSGATIELLYLYLKEFYPPNVVKIAVIAVTTNKPLIDADYCLYHNWTQARFPWSHDA